MLKQVYIFLFSFKNLFVCLPYPPSSVFLKNPFTFPPTKKHIIFLKIMSVHSRQSFHLQCHEEDNLLPEELSGDEDGEDHDENDLHEMHKTGMDLHVSKGFFPPRRTSSNLSLVRASFPFPML